MGFADFEGSLFGFGLQKHHGYYFFPDSFLGIFGPRCFCFLAILQRVIFVSAGPDPQLLIP